MDELATALRRERWLLRVLLFRLTEMQHLLAADDARFLGWASAEVEDAVARVREAELIRHALVSRSAREMEIADYDFTLSSFTRVAPEPYGEIVAEHRAAILELVTEVQSVAQTNRRLATRAIRGPNHDGPNADDAGTALEAQLAPEGYEAALAAAAHLSLPTLVEFLR